MKIKFILILLCLLILSGCISVPVRPPDVRINNVFIKPDEVLTKDCSVTKPISKQDYLSTPVDKREESLYNYAKFLLTDLTVCNSQLKNLRTWIDSQDKLFNTEDKK